jgi:hypothetical protein
LPQQRDQIQENVYFLHTKHIENKIDGQRTWFREKGFVVKQQSTGQMVVASVVERNTTIKTFMRSRKGDQTSLVCLCRCFFAAMDDEPH